jgi:rubredoxin
MKHACKMCSHIYVEEEGCPESGIAPGTPFDELPDSWVCPQCGAGKDSFEVIDI